MSNTTTNHHTTNHHTGATTMDTTENATITEQELETLYQTQFAAQDAWEATGCAVGNEQHKTYKVAFNAYRAARSAYINS